MMSANIFSEGRQASLNAGVGDFVSKPVYPYDLYAKLNKSLPLHECSAANTLFLEFEALLSNTYGEPADQLGQQIEVFDYPAALKIVASISQAALSK